MWRRHSDCAHSRRVGRAGAQHMMNRSNVAFSQDFLSNLIPLISRHHRYQRVCRSQGVALRSTRTRSFLAGSETGRISVACDTLRRYPWQIVSSVQPRIRRRTTGLTRYRFRWPRHIERGGEAARVFMQVQLERTRYSIDTRSKGKKSDCLDTDRDWYGGSGSCFLQIDESMDGLSTNLEQASIVSRDGTDVESPCWRHTGV